MLRFINLTNERRDKVIQNIPMQSAINNLVFIHQLTLYTDNWIVVYCKELSILDLSNNSLDGEGKQYEMKKFLKIVFVVIQIFYLKIHKIYSSLD